MSLVNRKSMKEFIEEYRTMIQIGKIVSIMDPEHPEYLEELFLVIGFQLDMNNSEHIVVVMNHEYKQITTHIDTLILKELFTIDDMFPADRSTFFERLATESIHEV